MLRLGRIRISEREDRFSGKLPTLAQRSSIAVFITIEVLHHNFGSLGEQEVDAANPGARVVDSIVGEIEIE